MDNFLAWALASLAFLLIGLSLGARIVYHMNECKQKDLECPRLSLFMSIQWCWQVMTFLGVLFTVQSTTTLYTFFMWLAPWLLLSGVAAFALARKLRLL